MAQFQSRSSESDTESQSTMTEHPELEGTPRIIESSCWPPEQDQQLPMRPFAAPSWTSGCPRCHPEELPAFPGVTKSVIT